MRLGCCPKWRLSFRVLSSCDVFIYWPWSPSHLRLNSPLWFIDLSAYLTEKENEVPRGPRLGSLGFLFLVPPPVPCFASPSAVFSLWSPVLPAISCPVCLTHTVGRQVPWFPGCSCGGWQRSGGWRFGKSGHWLEPMVLGPLWGPESRTLLPQPQQWLYLCDRE